MILNKYVQYLIIKLILMFNLYLIWIFSYPEIFSGKQIDRNRCKSNDGD